MDEKCYWLGFSVFPGIGPMRFKKLLNRFRNAKTAWESSFEDLKVELGQKTAEKFNEFRGNFSIENYVKVLRLKEVSFLTTDDKEYPKLLSQIKNPPFVLYIKVKQSLVKSINGAEVANENFRDCERDKTQSLHKHMPASQINENFISSPRQDIFYLNKTIAVVGTRKITEYGKEVTSMITRELVSYGFTIVSGLALGVDAVSHKTAIESGGKTIAVLGCGVDFCTPEENSGLYQKIIETGGSIVSEFPIGHPPTIGSFPSRNRIIAGLSQAVIVTEGAEDSGALITASNAASLHRPVFAVPGPITSNLSKGPHKLISKGAILVTSAVEILNNLDISGKIKDQKSIPIQSGSKIKNKGSNKEENLILQLLENEGMGFDEIVRRTKLSSSKAGSLLSLMEIKGLIKSSTSGIFSIARYTS